MNRTKHILTVSVGSDLCKNCSEAHKYCYKLRRLIMSEMNEIITCEVCGNTELVRFWTVAVILCAMIWYPQKVRARCTTYPIEIHYCETVYIAHQRYQVQSNSISRKHIIIVLVSRKMFFAAWQTLLILLNCKWDLWTGVLCWMWVVTMAVC